MENKLTEAQKYVWQGAIPLLIQLHESEVTTVPPPPPALILAPRIGYLPLLIPQIKPFFTSTLPPGVDTVWFEYKGLPLKWYIPTGVLFDLLCAEPERPWNLTVHFRGYPENILTPCEGEESVKWSFINSLKEAAYVINGNCKNIMNMSQSDQLELWRSILNGNLEAYIRIATKLKLGLGGDDFSIKLNSSSTKTRQSASDGDASGPTKPDKIPVRLYVRIINEDFDDLEDVPAFDNWDRISYINRPVEISGEGKCYTLSDALKALLPEFFPDKSLTNDLVPIPAESDDGQSTPSGEAGNMRSAEETGETVCNRLDSLSLLDSAEIKLIRIQGMLIQRRKIFFGFLCPVLDFCRTNKKTFLLDHSCIATQRLSHLFSTLNSQKIPKDIHEVNRKIRHLIQSGCHQDARNLFDRLTNRNTITWNLMISGYVKHREIAKARQLFDGMPERDVVSWNSMITGYMSCRGTRYLLEGRHLFDEMTERDFISWNTMITGYAKSGKMTEALKLFDAMPEKNVVSWNAIISGFLQNGEVKLGIEYFKKMPQRDAASLSVLVSGLIQNEELDEAATVLQEFEETGEGNEDLVHAYNTLIAGYGHKGKVSDARKLFDQMPFYADDRRSRDGIRRLERNLVSWNSMIMGYVKAGDVVSARDLFDQMVERDTFSWNTMISGYVHVSDMKEASKLFSRMPNPDILSWNSIISGFAESGNLKLAHNFFDRMPRKNRVSWNSIIAGCERNGEYEGAINHFIRMQAVGEKPDRHTLSSLLSASAETVALHLGMQIHQLATKIVVPDIPLNNSLITMYSRCGEIVNAKAVFDEMSFQKDVISWNAMIGGYASHGYAMEALELFESMKQQFKVRPTYITFISVLHACAHAGFVDKGRFYFTSMIKEFGIEPRVEHFSSLVDIVGRHGNVEEAANIIKSMPMDPDAAVWGALLGACKVHNNVELAQVAAEALIKLEPESSGPYVLLYNMYVDIGRWDDANKIRMVMEGSKVKKECGYSKVDTGF